MSAWIVSKDHIDLMLTAALACELAVPEQADETGRMLWLECVESVSFYYPNDGDGEWPGPIGFKRADAEGYVFESYPGRIDPQVVLEATGSYTYQSCEHPGWGQSQSRAWAERLIRAASARLEDYVRRYGPIDPHLQQPGQNRWYTSIGRDGVKTVRGGGWSIDGRDCFVLTERLRVSA